VARLLAAIALTLAGGTIGFRQTLGESWFQALYRSVVTATLAGLDTIPRNNGAGSRRSWPAARVATSKRT